MHGDPLPDVTFVAMLDHRPYPVELRTSLELTRGHEARGDCDQCAFENHVHIPPDMVRLSPVLRSRQGRPTDAIGLRHERPWSFGRPPALSTGSRGQGMYIALGGNEYRIESNRPRPCSPRNTPRRNS